MQPKVPQERRHSEYLASPKSITYEVKVTPLKDRDIHSIKKHQRKDTIKQEIVYGYK
jgi:hypothetical protein